MNGKCVHLMLICINTPFHRYKVGMTSLNSMRISSLSSHSAVTCNSTLSEIERQIFRLRNDNWTFWLHESGSHTKEFCFFCQNLRFKIIAYDEKSLIMNYRGNELFMRAYYTYHYCHHLLIHIFICFRLIDAQTFDTLSPWPSSIH